VPSARSSTGKPLASPTGCAEGVAAQRAAELASVAAAGHGEGGGAALPAAGQSREGVARGRAGAAGGGAGGADRVSRGGSEEEGSQVSQGVSGPGDARCSLRRRLTHSTSYLTSWTNYNAHSTHRQCRCSLSSPPASAAAAAAATAPSEQIPRGQPRWTQQLLPSISTPQEHGSGDPRPLSSSSSSSRRHRKWR